MDVSSAHVVYVSASVNGPCDLKQSYANQKQWCNTTTTYSEEGEMEKLGNALCNILHVCDDQLLLSASLATPTTQEKLEPSNIISLVKEWEIPEKSLHLTALSAAPKKKLISAMKGSREKLGIPVPKLSVTWAADVYEPPVTSLSHTATSHRQHSRNKKSSKHRQKAKSSSSQGSNSSKRYPKNVGKSSHRSSKSSSERTVFGGYNRSTFELMDFAVIDSKCGSSFLGTSLPKLNMPVTEAA